MLGRVNRLVTAGALSYAAIGVAALARPSMVPAVFGGTAPSPDSRSEIRAVYGGLPLAAAGLLAAAPAASAGPVALLRLGMAAGRATGMALEDAPPSGPTRFFLGVELALFATLGLAARGLRR